MATNQIDRRNFERFQLDPGYTSIKIRRHDELKFRLSGHAYDISEGGIQFELDTALEPGTTISMQIDLPRHVIDSGLDIGPGRAVFVTGNVVWCDADEPGAARMALAVTRYDRAGDKERLLRSLSAGQFVRAA